MKRWKEINGITGRYYISNCGDVVSMNRGKSITMKPHLNKRGYLRICFGHGYKTITRSIHRLVAMAFCHGYEIGKQVNHIDGNKKNNKSSNLEWVTNLENREHGKKMGLFPRGEQHPNSILNLAQVNKIRDIKKETGMSNRKIALKFGVHKDTVKSIISGRTWSKSKEIIRKFEERK